MGNELILELKPKLGLFTFAFSNAYPFRLFILWILLDTILKSSIEWLADSYFNLFANTLNIYFLY